MRPSKDSPAKRGQRNNAIRRRNPAGGAIPAGLKLNRPTRLELLSARERTVVDVIAPALKVLFCGINPGLYSAWAGHHFARPGNRFWPALFASGFTDRLVSPWEESELLRLGFGITNLVDRATVGSDELSEEELEAGGKVFQRKVRKYQPRSVAILGVVAYRIAFRRPEAQIGLQPERLAGAAVWVLPNPSGLNAHFTPPALVRIFHRMRETVLEKRPG